ncbi:PR-1-like protein, partial [Violaceomyces palustris]
TKAVASSFSNATVSGSSSSNSTNSTTLNTFTSSILSQHNTYRSKHKVGSLSWDATIAATAQTQADSCVYGHPSNLKTGQNIFAGTGTSWTSKDASDSWYNEVTSYDFSNPGFSSSTGHFTQMVWKGTTKLGCAISTSCTGSQLGFGGIGSKSSYIVCNYMSPGNVQGLFLQNVLP